MGGRIREDVDMRVWLLVLSTVANIFRLTELIFCHMSKTFFVQKTREQHTVEGETQKIRILYFSPSVYLYLFLQRLNPQIVNTFSTTQAFFLCIPFGSKFKKRFLAALPFHVLNFAIEVNKSQVGNVCMEILSKKSFPSAKTGICCRSSIILELATCDMKR